MSEKKKKKNNSVTGLELLAQTVVCIPFFRDDSLPRARSRLSQICFLSFFYQLEEEQQLT